MDAVAMYQENKCDNFISIGGGSSHDECRGARVSVDDPVLYFDCPVDHTARCAASTSSRTPSSSTCPAPSRCPACGH